MSDVFPLHLSPFEEFMLLDEHPGYRMTFLVEQSFDGEIDRAAFDAGVTEALRRLRCSVQTCGRASFDAGAGSLRRMLNRRWIGRHTTNRRRTPRT